MLMDRSYSFTLWTFNKKLGEDAQASSEQDEGILLESKHNVSVNIYLSYSVLTEKQREGGVSATEE